MTKRATSQERPSLLFRIFADRNSIDRIRLCQIMLRQFGKAFDQHRIGILPGEAKRLFGLVSKV